MRVFILIISIFCFNRLFGQDTVLVPTQLIKSKFSCGIYEHGIIRNKADLRKKNKEAYSCMFGSIDSLILNKIDFKKNDIIWEAVSYGSCEYVGEWLYKIPAEKKYLLVCRANDCDNLSVGTLRYFRLITENLDTGYTYEKVLIREKVKKKIANSQYDYKVGRNEAIKNNVETITWKKHSYVDSTYKILVDSNEIMYVDNLDKYGRKIKTDFYIDTKYNQTSEYTYLDSTDDRWRINKVNGSGGFHFIDSTSYKLKPKELEIYKGSPEYVIRYKANGLIDSVYVYRYGRKENFVIIPKYVYVPKK